MAEPDPDALIEQHLASDATVCGGQVCVKGTRIPAALILGAMAGGDTIDDLLRGYPGLTREDVAAALAAMLVSDGHAGRDYAITAPRPYTLAEVAAALGRSSGKTIVYQALGSDEFRAQLEAASLPPPVVNMTVALGEAIRAGEFDAASNDVEALLGRAPVALDAFLASTPSS